MSNKTATATATATATNENLLALLNNVKFVESARINEILTLENKILKLDEEKWNNTIDIGFRFKISLQYLKSEHAKESAKECNVKLTNENMAIMFRYSLPQFNRYKALSKLDSEVIENYEKQTKERSLIGLLKFSNTKNEVSEVTNEESEENEENEVEVKNDVNIKVDRKKNKLVWKGVATLDILDMIILEAQRQKAELLKLAEKK